jgi:DNA-binding transcriptional MerR regulator
MSILTMGDVATRFGVQVWQVRRLFERGLLPPAARVGAYRVVAADDLPAVEQALRTAGYLKDAVADAERRAAAAGNSDGIGE